jgi:hypothetical protein
MAKDEKKPIKKVANKSAKKPEKKQDSKPVKKAPIKLIESSNILRWKAPDYYTFERSPYWSLVVGLVSMVLSLILIYTQNFFPVIIIILAVIVTFQVAHEKPKTQEFAIDESGVLAREVYLPFYELDSFWIAKHGSKSILYIGRVGAFKGPIAIPLGQQNQIEVKNFLLRYLPEKIEYGEQLSEKLIRIFKL